MPKKFRSTRREFIKQNSLAGIGAFLATAGISGCGVNMATEPGEKDSAHAEFNYIRGMTLEQLRENYNKDLFGKFLPNMDKFVIDHEYGGFMCNVDIRTGKQLSTAKRAWYEGRGIWVYSFLYNNFKQDPDFLEVARKSKDFILKHQPQGDDFWISSYTREGLPNSGSGDIYCNLFIAEGLAEFSRASGESHYLKMAKNIILSALARYDRIDYDYQLNYGPANAPEISAPRVLGHWMVFLRSATQILQQEPDPEIEMVANRSVEAIMKHHVNPEYHLLNEVLNHDLSLPNNEWGQFAYLGHGCETLWMVLDEAVRRKDDTLFDSAEEAFKRHVNVATDAVYGGYFRSLDNVAEYKYKLDKVLWLQEEILIGTILLMEHTNDNWARNQFAQTYKYIQEKFIHPEYAFVIPNGDRKMITYNTNRVEHYHHPRHLMLNLLALERMIKRGGFNHREHGGHRVKSAWSRTDD